MKKILSLFLSVILTTWAAAATYETYQRENESKLASLYSALGSPAGVKLIAARLLLYNSTLEEFTTQSSSCKDSSGKDQTYSDVARTHAALTRLSVSSVSTQSVLFSTRELDNNALCAKWGLFNKTTPIVKGTAVQYGEILELYMIVNGAGTFEALYSVAKSVDDYMSVAIDPEDVTSMNDLDFANYYDNTEKNVIWSETTYGNGLDVSGINTMEGHEFAPKYGGTSTHVIVIRQTITENRYEGFRQSSAAGFLSLAKIRWKPLKFYTEFLPENTGLFHNPVVSIGQDASQNKDGVQVDGNFSDFGYSLHYTLDGKTPTTSSPNIEMTPFDLVFDAKKDGKTIVTVRAFDAQGKYIEKSEITGNFTFQVSTPAATIGAPEDKGLPITLTCETQDAKFKYTTDGSLPGPNNGTVTNSSFFATKPGLYTIVATRSNYLDSEPITLDLKQTPKPNIIVRINGSTIKDDFYTPGDNTRVFLTTANCDDKTPVIRYTTDGSKPDNDDSEYSGPFTATNIAARTFLDGYIPGEIATRKLVCADKSFEFYKPGSTPATAEAIAIHEGWNPFVLNTRLTDSAKQRLVSEFTFFNSAATKATASDLLPGKVLWFFMPAESFAEFSGFCLENCAVTPEPSEFCQPVPGWNFMSGSTLPSLQTPAWFFNGMEFLPDGSVDDNTPVWFYQD